MIAFPFTKMHGLRNDFVLIEQESLHAPLTPEQVRFLCDRRAGVGCDQLILIKKRDRYEADLCFFNADGQMAMACGNGSRCAARYLGVPEGILHTPSGPSLFSVNQDEVTVSFSLPPPPIPEGKGYRIDLGNPHFVQFVPDLERVDLEKMALPLQGKEGINVEVAQVLSSHHIRAVVWERGVGPTPACGSGACALAFLGVNLGLVSGSSILIDMVGGSLKVACRPEGLFLTGPAVLSFEGIIVLP